MSRGRYMQDACRITTSLARDAARIVGEQLVEDWPVYQTDKGVLTIELHITYTSQAWRWKLDGRPININRANELIAARMESRCR